MLKTLLAKLKNRTITLDELQLLKSLLQEQMEQCELKGQCEQAMSLNIYLNMVNNLLQKRKN